MAWEQNKYMSVSEYATYVRKYWPSKSNGALWRKQFGCYFDPDSMEEWFEDGLNYHVSKELQRILRYRNVSSNGLTLNELLDVAQDAEDLLTLLTRSKGSVEFLVDRYSHRYRNRGFHVNDNGFVIVYIDGACLRNGTSNAKAGIGIWFADDHCKNVSEPIISDTPTARIAKIWAIIRALQIAEDNDIHHLEVRSDSYYLIKFLNSWIYKWLDNGWINSKIRPTMPKCLFRQLLSLMRNMIRVQWVYTRQKDNAEADYLAHQGAQHCQQFIFFPNKLERRSQQE